MPWYVLNHISPTPGKSMRPAQQAVDNFNRTNDARVDFFAPTIREVRVKNGQEEAVERPLTYHYVFLRATEEEAKRLCALDNGFSFVIDRAGNSRHAIVSDKAMTAFQQIARHYGNTLPFFSLDAVDLQEGDRIEIVDGDFAGLEGTYLPRERSNKGNVVITSDSGFASMIFDVKASHIRVLEFAPGTRRPYDIIDAFVPRLRGALQTHNSGQPLTERQLTDLLLFIRRMENVRLDNHKIEAKLLALLIAAKRLLGSDEASIRPLLDRYQRRRLAVTNPKTQLLLKELLPN